MILSFDIGIKNLAYCIMYKNENKTITIEKWDVIQLLNDDTKAKIPTPQKNIKHIKTSGL